MKNKNKTIIQLQVFVLFYPFKSVNGSINPNEQYFSQFNCLLYSFPSVHTQHSSVSKHNK